MKFLFQLVMVSLAKESLRSVIQVHFKFLYWQVVWKGAHLLGCGKTFINGEPYYIAQMDTPGVIAGVPGYDKSNVGKPKEVRCSLFNLKGRGRL